MSIALRLISSVVAIISASLMAIHALHDISLMPPVPLVGAWPISELGVIMEVIVALSCVLFAFYQACMIAFSKCLERQ